MNFNHKSVMLFECIDALNIKENGIYVDGTAGGAGHSSEIAKRLSEKGKLFSFDKDPDAISVCRERLSQYPCAEVIQSDFADMEHQLKLRGVEKVDGILLDLGVSSFQLDTADRGFSYQYNAALDMRMSKTGLSAYDIVNTYSEKEISRILREFGEEKFSSRIAASIVRNREEKNIETTFELAEIIKNAIPAAARREGGNPAKRSFQAIRIAVNSELDSLSRCLDNALNLLNEGGRFAIITFHSLEDRMVKQKFAEWAKGCICPPEFPVCVCNNKPKVKLITRKPVEATQEELDNNRRSRSAKLRVAERL